MLFLASFFSADVVAQDWTISVDALGYSDSDGTHVATPQLGVVRALDDEGGNISARVTIDAITSASVDVVTHATRGFGEVRYQGDVGVSKRFRAHLPGLTYRFSHEPDYQSHSVGASLQSELGTPDSVLGLAYAVTHDVVSRSGSNLDAFSARLLTHTANVSYSQTLSPRTLLRAAYTLTYQHGYMEKPYRHVPLFTSADASLNRANFDARRLSLRPLEEVPDRRARHAFAFRLLHHVPKANVTLKFDYQLYVDSWSVSAHTLEPRVTWSISENVDLGLWLRAYRQSGASFWRRAYVVSEGEVPQFRSVDRDLSPYTALTAGLRFAWHNDSWGFYTEASVVQTFYDDFLYLDRLTALVFQLGMQVKL